MSTDTQLTVIERANVALNSDKVKKEFAALVAESASIIAITNNASYEECRAQKIRLMRARTELTKRGKITREDAQAFAKGVIALEKELLSITEPEENRLSALLAIEDAKREEKIAAERKRVEIIEMAIAALGERAIQMAGKPAAEIAEAQIELNAQDVKGWAMEFHEKAQEAKEKALVSLGQLHAGAMAQEKAAADAAAKLKAEQEELARLRAEQAKRDADANERAEAERKSQAEARAKLEAEEREAREKREAADKAAQAERDRLDAEALKARETEQRRLDEVAAKLRAEKEAEEARQRQAREAEEARLAEIRRQEMELADGQTLLTVFKDRFGKRREFAGVVKAIDIYFEKAAERKAA